jgi:hypothetical protein
MEDVLIGTLLLVGNIPRAIATIHMRRQWAPATTASGPRAIELPENFVALADEVIE